jgi:hypothetical protein
VIDKTAGRVMGNAIKLFGSTSPFVSKLWSFKRWREALPLSDAPLLVDKFLFAVNHMLPRLLPSFLIENSTIMCACQSVSLAMAN